MKNDRNSGKEKSQEKLKKGMIPDWLDDLFLKSVIPVIRRFAIARINPNWITVLAFLITIAASLLIIGDRLIVAAILIVVAGIFDFSDGKVAALTGRVTTFGGILDSVLDRYADTVVYLALIVYYAQRDLLITSFAVVLALVGSTMTSYLMAVGRSHGFDFRIGILRRQDRVTLISIGLLFTFAHAPIEHLFIGLAARVGWVIGDLPIMPLTAVVWFLAIFTNYTSLQRFLLLRKLARLSDQPGTGSSGGVAPDGNAEVSLKEKQLKTLFQKVNDLDQDRSRSDETK
ncbi:CDP-alcohol phosphatidyltransferase family protein [Gemmatimonadota bacterium]